jgi:hypothetical protein
MTMGRPVTAATSSRTMIDTFFTFYTKASGLRTLTRSTIAFWMRVTLVRLSWRELQNTVIR